MLRMKALSGIALMGLLFFSGCKPAATEEAVEVVEEEMVAVEPVVWIIDEYHLNEIPITDHPTAQPRKKEAAVDAAPPVSLDDPYTVKSTDNFVVAVAEVYEVDNPVVAVTEAAIPLEETQTISSFNAKGKDMGAVQIVSNGATGEIDHIIFQDKNHKDYYDVQAGMSGKEARHLRKELKHMYHKGKVFFYTDDSNIMYLTDIQYADGEEITEADLDESVVTAIVWKDKKHKDHPKHAKK